ncbi:MAG: aminotransferase class III-fold pyridoxal phosphate-dependent enzyme [Planctomycetota bacterium]|nr:aminotransferase class III-fold pyridoxal phosphate-dependent enzyme [Planctomycetota bacterium]
MPSYEKSRELYERACRVLAGGVASEFRKFSAPHPLFYVSGAGSRLTDVDGNVYLDFTLSQGPLVLGHSHPEVLAAVQQASAAGQLYAGQHLQELELAESLQRLIPCAELLRFSLSGSEADHAALRLARAVTGRNRFLRFEGHYHGWFDNVAVGVGGTLADLGPRDNPTPVRWSQGLPAQIEQESLVLPWNDLALVEQAFARHGNELAAVITEPVMCNNGCIPPEPGFLRGLRDICDRHGTVLIFDEVITGFRTGLGGAQTLFGVTPDLAVFGKAMASGYPISVLAGKKKFMQPIADGKVIHAGTMNSGNPSIAAALATLRVLERDQIPESLKAKGECLMAGLADVAQRAGHPLRIQGLGPMFHAGFTTLPAVRDYRDTLTYDKPAYAKFVVGMQDRGIRLIGRGLWYVSAAHSADDIDQAISTAYDVLKGM